MAGEFEFIEWLKQQRRQGSGVVVGSGDDMAVVSWKPSDLLLIGVDQVIDGVHFDSAIHTPRQIGRKVVNRNLSDCAAMGCVPAAAVVSVALPEGCGLEYAKAIYSGMVEAADRFDCPIIGGDTASWPGKLVASVTMLGRSGGVEPVRRSGARVGDRIYVTGPLGGSILGRHMDFEPLVELAHDMARYQQIHAMIDISDGLSRDLAHICRASNVGASIEADAIPIHEDAHRLEEQDGRAALEHALHDGEDHELIIVSPDELDLVCIGRMTESRRIVMVDSAGEHELIARAWEHRL